MTAPMTWIDRISLFSALDYAALALLVLAWVGIGWKIENPAAHRPSVSVLMEGFRRDWMRRASSTPSWSATCARAPPSSPRRR